MDPSGTKDDRWDSGEAWSAARERVRDEVRAALAPQRRVCPSCGNEEVTGARTCSRCGSSFVALRDPGLSRRARRRIALAAVAVAVVLGVAAAVIVPSLQSGKRSAGAADRRATAAALARERRRIALDQRLHTAAFHGSGAAQVRSGLEAAITADARARVRAHTLQGPILRTKCSPVKGRGRYSCVAVNAEILRNSAAPVGSLGYPFWAIVDYRRRTYRWCKLNPQAGEGSATPGSVSLAVPVPRGCDVERR